MARFVFLIAAHVTGGIALTLGLRGRGAPDVFLCAFVGLLLAQGALIAVWAGLSDARKSFRCLGACVGALFLWAVLLTADSGGRSINARMVAYSTLFVAAGVFPAWGAFLALKRWGPRLAVYSARDLAPAHQPFQFTIRHLFIVAFGVSVALVLGRIIRAMDQGNQSQLFLFALVMAVCLIHAALAAVWAGLGPAKVLYRAPLAVAAAVLVGLIPPFYLQATEVRGFLDGMLIAGLAQIIVIGSLLVARSAGYRVVRRRTTDRQTPTDAQPLSAHPLD